MRRGLHLAVLFATLAAAGDARALDPSRAPRHYVSRSWSADEGLTESTVHGIAQSSDGYVWLGTEGGLTRFDGVRFHVLDDRDGDASLAGADVQDVCFDAAGSMWIATRGRGLLRRDASGLRAYGAAQGVDPLVARLSCATKGVWAATVHGLVRVDDAPRTLGLDEEAIAVADDGAGGAWVGTAHGFFRVTDGQVAPLAQGALPSGEVSAVLADGDGGAWLGGVGWLAHFDRGSVTTWTAKDGFSSHPVTSLARDAAGSLWIGCEDDALVRFREGTFERFATEDGLVDTAIIKVTTDLEGSLWIGTSGDGVQRLVDPKAITLTKRDGVPGDAVWCAFADRDGDVWAGTRNGGVVRFHGDAAVARITKADGLPTDTVYGIGQGRDGAMWFATRDGVARAEDGRWSRFGAAQGLASDRTHSVFGAPDGAVWIGTDGGVSVYRDGAFTSITTKDGLKSDRILEIDGGEDGAVWIGTDGGGAARWKDGRIEVFDQQRGVADDGVHSASPGPNGTTWLATFHGVSWLRGDRIVNATTKEGLSDDVTFAVVPLGDALFVPTNHGLTEVPQASFEALARGAPTLEGAKTYGKGDGIASPEFNGGMPTAARDGRGRLWMANLAGLVVVDPAHLRRNARAPTPIIEEVALNRESPQPPRGDLRLPSSTREISIRYTAPSFVVPERVRFRYRLLGFEPSWVEAGDRRVAYFTSLPPGDYTFEVIAANDDGVWQTHPATLRIYLAPRFYQTPWFFAGAALALAALGWSAARLRVRALKVRARELERRVEERTRELADRDRAIQADLARARDFQERTLPALPARGALQFAAMYVPAAQVGGDLYDVLELGAGHFRVFIADITGHGVQAAMRTMVLRTEYGGVTRACAGPAEVLAELNRRLAQGYRDLGMRCSAACVDVRVDDAGGATVVYANAAHPPLLHVTGGRVEEIFEPGAYLAMLPDLVPRERTFRLAPRDLLVLLTDGAYEQPNEHGREIDLERIGEIVRAHAPDPDAAARAVVEGVRAWAGQVQADDDVTVVCVARTGVDPSPVDHSSPRA